MANIDEEFQGNYLKAEDLKGKDVPLVIDDAEIVEFKDESGPQKKVVLGFRRTEKRLVCNKTNRDTIRELYGPETGDWIGQTIVVFPTKTEFGGKRVPCIRVRDKDELEASERQQARTKQPAAQPAPAVVNPDAEDPDDVEIPF